MSEKAAMSLHSMVRAPLRALVLLAVDLCIAMGKGFLWLGSAIIRVSIVFAVFPKPEPRT